MVKAVEKAVLTVNGQNYEDWETVSVRHALREMPYFTFRFTCSEGMPLAKNKAKLRIRPGDDCTITLAGQPAFTGLVHTRQVFYDSHRHHIEIQGASRILALSSSSVIHQTHEMNNATFTQVASELLKKYGIAFVAEGGPIPTTKFPRVLFPPGISVADALEIAARPLGGLTFTTNVKGDFVVIMGPNGVTDTVVEGKSILEGREIIYWPAGASANYASGQRPGGDNDHGSKVSHEPFHAGNPMANITGYLPQAFLADIPAWTKAQLEGRTLADELWQNTDFITVWITVQGWLRPGGGLWVRGQKVQVISPMLIMNGTEGLEAWIITFTQDNQRGTRTTLELRNKKAQGADVPQGPGPGEVKE